MEKTLVWKQTSKLITQVLLSEVIKEIDGKDGWTSETIKENLLKGKKSIFVEGVKYHVWRDCLM